MSSSESLARSSYISYFRESSKNNRNRRWTGTEQSTDFLSPKEQTHELLHFSIDEGTTLGNSLEISTFHSQSKGYEKCALTRNRIQANLSKQVTSRAHNVYIPLTIASAHPSKMPSKKLSTFPTPVASKTPISATC